MTAFACYDLENVKTVGYEVLVNRPKTGGLSRAVGADGGLRGRKRDRRAGQEDRHGSGRVPHQERGARKAPNRPTVRCYGPIGIGPTLEAAKKHPHMKAPLGKNQGRGMACGFWFNFGGQTCTDLNIGTDGTVTLAVGTVDVGGSRASLSLMAAEELGIPYDAGAGGRRRYRHRLGYNDMTDGSRGTFSSSMATISAARNAIKSLAGTRGQDVGHSCRRGRLGRGSRDGRRATSTAISPPLSLKDIAAKAGNTGGPIAGHSELGRRRRGRLVRHPHLRRRSRSGDRRHQDTALHGRAGCRQGGASRPMWKGSTRAVPRRASAGRSTRSTSTARTGGCRMPASSTTASRSARTCR